MKYALFSTWKLARMLFFASIVALALLLPGKWLQQPHALQAHAASSCQPEPSGFNPLTATAAQLALYNFPPRPTNSNALANWKTLVSGVTSTYCMNSSNTKQVPLASSASSVVAEAKENVNAFSASDSMASIADSTINALDNATTVTTNQFASGYDVEGSSTNPITEISGRLTLSCIGASTSQTAQSESVVGDSVIVGISTDYATGGHKFVWWTGNLGSASDMNIFEGTTLVCRDTYMLDEAFDTSSNTYSLTARDMTSGQLFHIPVSGSLDPDAFVGETRPSDSTSLYNFGEQQWSQCQYVAGTYGTPQPLTTAPQIYQFSMVGSGTSSTILAQPTALSSDGMSFNDNWKNAGP